MTSIKVRHFKVKIFLLLLLLLLHLRKKLFYFLKASHMYAIISTLIPHSLSNSPT